MINIIFNIISILYFCVKSFLETIEFCISENTPDMVQKI